MNFEVALNCPDCGESFPLGADARVLGKYALHRGRCKIEEAFR